MKDLVPDNGIIGITERGINHQVSRLYLDMTPASSLVHLCSSYQSTGGVEVKTDIWFSHEVAEKVALAILQKAWEARLELQARKEFAERTATEGAGTVPGPSA